VTKRLHSMVRSTVPVSGSICRIRRARCWPRDRGQHAAGLGVDLLNSVRRELEEVPAVEGGSGMGGDFDRTHGLAVGGIEGIHLVAGGEPDVPAVERDAMHGVDAWKGTILADDFGC
jgi:hypothetical protein